MAERAWRAVISYFAYPVRNVNRGLETLLSVICGISSASSFASNSKFLKSCASAPCRWCDPSLEPDHSGSIFSFQDGLAAN